MKLRELTWFSEGQAARERQGEAGTTLGQKETDSECRESWVLGPTTLCGGGLALLICKMDVCELPLGLSDSGGTISPAEQTGSLGDKENPKEESPWVGLREGRVAYLVWPKSCRSARS